jgi:hypothetical protein
VTSIILVKIRDYPAVQIFMLLNISIFRQIYLLHTKPFILLRDILLAFFNEFFFSLYLYVLMINTDFNVSEGDTKNYASFLLLGITSTYILMNTIYYIVFIVSKALPWVRLCFRKCIQSKCKRKKA